MQNRKMLKLSWCSGSASKTGKRIVRPPFRRCFHQPIRRGRGHASGSFQHSGSRSLIAGWRHVSVEAFGYPVVLRETEPLGKLFRPRVQHADWLVFFGCPKSKAPQGVMALRGFLRRISGGPCNRHFIVLSRENKKFYFYQIF